MPCIVIVGAGQAGQQIAESLRRRGFEGEVVMVGDETSPPYQRPPLSKKFLLGEFEAARLRFRPDSWYEKHAVELRTASRATAIHRDGRYVEAEDGTRLQYDGLALATGTRARELPGLDHAHPRVSYLRTLDDAAKLKRLVEAGGHVVVIGGGFIGLEVAASARGAGLAATVCELQPRLMARAVAPALSEFFEALHQRHGVSVNCGVGLDAVELRDDGVSCALSDGRELAADFVVVGVGAVPADELASACGLECRDGIVVDECARTLDPAIVAAGDCTFHRNVRLEVEHRLESVQNAVDQAKVAAASLLGAAEPYGDIPWFWSDQFDVKLQMAGGARGATEAIVRGNPDAGAFSVFHFGPGGLLGVDSINRPADHMAARRLLAAGVSPSTAQAADAAFDLKSLV